MPVGPVDLLVLSFPSESADAAVIAAMQDVVDAGFITVLDLVFLSRSPDGEIREIDITEGLDGVGFGLLEIQQQALISDDDLELARDILDPGHSCAVVVYENSWARAVSGAIADAGGDGLSDGAMDRRRSGPTAQCTGGAAKPGGRRRWTGGAATIVGACET